VRFQPGFRYGASSAVIAGALGLLAGETAGFAIDATTYPATVAVIDTGTPANDLSNVGLDASNLVQSGTSPKLVHHVSSPYVRWSPHNMFLNSGTPATQNVTLVVGFVYTITVTGAGGGDITGSAGASGTATTGSPATFTATTTTGTFTLTGSLDTIQLNRGATATAYLATTGAIRIGIPQSYDAAAAQYGILVEPAGMNLCLQSQTLATAPWGINNATIDAENTTAPDGTTTAERITESAGTELQNIYQSIATISSNTNYALSVYVKAGTQSNVGLYLTKAGGGEEHIHATFNLATGATGETDVGTTSGTVVSSSITAVGDGWYRCVLVGRITETTGYFCVTPLATATGNSFDSSGEVSYAGTGKTIFVWGAQLELGTAATSYIPTLGSSVTRAADNLSVAASSFPWSATTNTVYVDGKLNRLSPNGTSADFWNVFEDAQDYLGVYNDSTNWRFYSVSASVLDVHGTLSALSLGTRTQITYALAGNDHDASQDGGAAVSDTSGAVSNLTNDTMFLGRDAGTAANVMVGFIYRFAQVPRQVETDANNVETWRYNF
jgi:hypothetical protein